MLEKIAQRIKHHECCPQKHLNGVHLNSSFRLMQAFLREELLSATYQDNKVIFSLPRTTRILYIDTIQLGSLSRYRSFGNIYIEEKNSVRQITDPKELLDICITELNQEVDNGKWEKFSQEINDHLRNALLTSYKSCHVRKKIAEEAKQQRHANFIDWLKNQKQISDTTIFFEQWASRGHPHHPCCKTKLGFSLEDVVNYSPEFHPEVPLKVAAIRKEYVHVEALYSKDNYREWFANSFPETWLAWCDALNERKLAFNNFIPMPIHPWQANKMTELFEKLMEEGVLYLIPNISINATPTLSFRTLAPVGNTNAPYIKLPVAVQATSVFRTLSPATTETTPRISRLLSAILEKENYFNTRFSILNELYGLHLNHIPDEDGKHLTAIFRENPKTQLKDNEICIVVAALFEKSPVTDKSLLIELMEASRVTTLAEAIHYFRQYVDLVLNSYLDLYLLYGISLEGHQQNTLAVFEDGRIARFIARDFDGTDIHADSLSKAGFTLMVHPSAPNLWQHRKEVRLSLLHSVYQCHLGELVLLLANHYQCEETFFWQEIKKSTEARFAELKPRMNLETWQQEYAAILENEWPCKALLRMRLQKKYNPEGLFFNIENPLVAAI